MKVLVVHNRYRSDVPSGENIAVDAEVEALRAAPGVTVLTYFRSSDEIASFNPARKLLLPVRPVHSPTDVREVRRLLVEERPDVLHLHNPNPLISMSVVDAAEAAGVPVVMSIHNARHSCLNGAYFRDGHPCRQCEGRRVAWPGVVHGCYRDSRLQSVPAAAALALHSGSYARVRRYLAVSGAIRDQLVAAGFPAERIVVKPNLVADPGPGTPASSGDLLFVGRMTEVKGVALLLDAWRGVPDGTGPRLVLVGSGPLEAAARALAAQRTDLVVTGQVDPRDVDAHMRAARAVLVPSVWEEPFGLVALEAYARSRPVLTTGLGGLADLCAPGGSWQVEPSADRWREALVAVGAADTAAMGAAGRRFYEQGFSPAAVVSALLQTYAAVA